MAISKINTNSLDDAAVTSAKAETLMKPLGVGQTWQNVTASRAYGTTYTNTTGRPIFVFVQSTGASSSSTATVAGEIAAAANTTSTASCVFFVVPAGATYVVTIAAASLQRWAELR